MNNWKTYLTTKKVDGVVKTYCVDVRYPDGSRKRPELGTADPVEAQAKYAAFIADILPGLKADWDSENITLPSWGGPNPRISAIFDYYTKEYLGLKGRSTSTMDHAAQVLRDFELYCRDKKVGRVSQLSRAIVDGHAAELLGRKRAHKTIAVALGVIRAALNAAIDAGLLERSPIKKWLIPDCPDPEIQPFTVEELRAILAAVRRYEPDEANIIEWMAYTGMRISDARSLKWAQVDINARLRFKTLKKTGRRNTIKFSRKAQQALLRERERGIKSEFVFTSQDGQQFGRNHVLRAWTRALKKAGFRHARLHDLRHTFCYTMLNIVKCPIRNVQHAMEHLNIKTTMKYCVAGPIDDDLDVFDKIVAGTTEKAKKRGTPRSTNFEGAA